MHLIISALLVCILSLYGCIPDTLYVEDDINLSSGCVSIILEGGYMSDYTVAYSKMRELNYKGTSYIVPSRVGWCNYLSDREIREMIDYGWEFGIVPYSGRDLIDMEICAIEDEVDRSIDYMCRFNYTPTTIILPYNSIDDRIREVIESRGLHIVVGMDHYACYDESYIAKVLSSNVWTSIHFGELSYRCGPELFYQILDIIVENDTNVVPIGQVLEGKYE